MKKFIETISNIWKIEELRQRILITLGLLLVYRFGAQVVLPGIDTTQLAELTSNTEQGILGILNAKILVSFLFRIETIKISSSSITY